MLYWSVLFNIITVYITYTVYMSRHTCEPKHTIPFSSLFIDVITNYIRVLFFLLLGRPFHLGIKPKASECNIRMLPTAVLLHMYLPWYYKTVSGKLNQVPYCHITYSLKTPKSTRKWRGLWLIQVQHTHIPDMAKKSKHMDIPHYFPTQPTLSMPSGRNKIWTSSQPSLAP